MTNLVRKPAGPDVYDDVVDACLGRALSMLDLEPSSPSRGSFDRTWWCWKFTDFPAARMQEGVFTLAWMLTSLHARSHRGDESRLADAMESGIRFWISIQHRDGSFDEAYPFERSLAATAFSSYYVGAAIERVRDLIDRDTIDTAFGAIERAAKWLHQNGEWHAVISNHLAAAAAALQVAGDLLGTDRFRDSRDRYLEAVIEHQDETEGWLREYGGADPGYQSHAMFYLSDVWRRTGLDELSGCLSKAAEFESWFVHPDGTVGGEYASRGTKFAFPAAFELLAQDLRSARAIRGALRKGVRDHRVITAATSDVWNFFPLLNNLLFAREWARSESCADDPRLPWEDAPSSTAIFPKARLAVVRRRDRLVVVGIGGTLKVWSLPSGDLVYEDCTYNVRKGTHAFTFQTTASIDVTTEADEVTLRITPQLERMNDTLFNPWNFAMFRLFMLTIGRFRRVSILVKRLLVWILIDRSDGGRETLQRTVVISNDGSTLVEDVIDGNVADAWPVSRQVPVHMGSARYVESGDFAPACTTPPGLPRRENGCLIRSTKV